MEALDKNILDALDQLKAAIQGSENLALYLEDEEETYYKALQDDFEPSIMEMYDCVANQTPLQLESFEKELLDEEFEGLFLPKSLGYSVLRGDIDENYRYRKPQEHFKKILLAICNSANFEIIKKRIGQTVQIGFALSSDIWITNLLDSIDNKKVKALLASYRSDKFRETSKRKEAYLSYKKQFSNVNFQSTDFPKNEIELKASYYSIKAFLTYRAAKNLDNTGLLPYVSDFVGNESMIGAKEYFELMVIIGLFYPMDEKTSASYQKTMTKIAKANPNFNDQFFQIYDNLYQSKELEVKPENEIKLGNLISNIGGDDIKKYFETTNEIHGKGIVHVDAIEAVRKYCEQYQGMSVQNECVRCSILGYVTRLINNLEPQDYPDYFEINKIITAYVNMFSNERFNQDVKSASMNFVQKCLVLFTDKRSKDYQDIKKYVSTTFVDLGFLSEKEVVEVFKTRRK